MEKIINDLKITKGEIVEKFDDLLIVKNNEKIIQIGIDEKNKYYSEFFEENEEYCHHRINEEDYEEFIKLTKLEIKKSNIEKNVEKAKKLLQEAMDILMENIEEDFRIDEDIIEELDRATENYIIGLEEN